MASTLTYQFRRAIFADLPLLSDWRALPHVVEWWGDPTINPERLDDPNIAVWIVQIERRPFAFLQDYDPHAWDNHPFLHLPPCSRGMDQFIGEPDMLDRGHGTALIRQHVEHLFSSGAPAVGTDPNPLNLRARRCYEKVGFVATTGPVETLWGTAILMERWRDQAPAIAR